MCDRKIIRYSIESGEVEEDLLENVNKKLKQGWQPIGGVTRSIYGVLNIRMREDAHDIYFDGYFFQAMVKYEKANDE